MANTIKTVIKEQAVSLTAFLVTTLIIPFLTRKIRAKLRKKAKTKSSQKEHESTPKAHQ
jgi:NADH:ubiquinone oxidoreductase subunit 3 (subunit A)